MLMTLALGALLLAPAQQDTTVPVSPGTRLVLDSRAGSITVRTWNRNALQVSADFESDRSRVGVEVTGNVARITRSGRRGMDHDMSADYRLTVPAWMELDLSSVEGDISVDNSEGRLNLTSVEGGITVRGGRDFISVSSVEGEVSIEGARGRIEASAVDGGILISNAEGRIFAETVDGDITMEAVVSDEVETNTVDGNITYRGRVSPSGRYRLGTHDGDILLEVPELDAVVSVSTFEGEFSSCGYQATTNGRDRSGNKKRFRFTIGNGGARVDLESFDGNIYLAKPGCQ